MKKRYLLLIAFIGASWGANSRKVYEESPTTGGQLPPHPAILSPTRERARELPVGRGDPSKGPFTEEKQSAAPEKKERGEGTLSVSADTAHSSPQTHTLPREKATMLVIKGGDIKAKVVGVASSDTVEIKTQGEVFRSRNGKALVIDGKDLALACDIKIPADMMLCVSGGKIDLHVTQVNSPMILEGGTIYCKGRGSFHATKITAAKLELDLKGIQKDLSILCGDGKIRVTYDLKDYLDQKKSKGLSLKRPPTVNIHLAKGQATFVFPKESDLFYRKGIKGLEVEGEPRYKGHDARIFVYIPPHGAKVILQKGG